MRYAILADIHANLSALQAVMKDIQQKGGAGEFWCLGDIVGYGPDPCQCIEVIKEYSSICVAGNHDWAAIGKIETSFFNPDAAAAAQWTRQQLSPQDIDFLKKLALTAEKGDFTLVHGSPRDPIWEYILTTAEAEKNLKELKTQHCFIGHSHLPLVFQYDAHCPGRTFKDQDVVRLAALRLIINPGSVGQPRDHDPRASYALYDSDAETITLHRIEYDIQATQHRMQHAGLPAALINRLAYGR